MGLKDGGPAAQEALLAEFTLTWKKWENMVDKKGVCPTHLAEYLSVFKEDCAKETAEKEGPT